jgi:hypothetical protein
MYSLQDKTVTTRHDHSCEWCGENIEAGSKAQYRAYVFEGVFCSGHQHLECYEAMTGADWRDLEDGFVAGDFKRGKHELRGE